MSEAVVVGAGPAGCVAALVLSRAGLRVEIVDMREFPRDKVCGDLIGTDAVAALRSLGLADTLSGAATLDGARVYGPGGTGAGRLHGVGRGAGSARVLERSTFDARLLEHAIRAGARFVNARVLGLARSERGVVSGVHTAAGGLEARVVIGADGYGSAVARSLRPRAVGPPRRGGVAIVARAYATGVRDLGAAMHFYVNRPGEGYGWVFPLPGGRANVGLGYIASEGPHDVRAGFDRFVGRDSPAASLLEGAHVAFPQTWPIALGWQGRVIAEPGVFLAGDAAELGSPLSGSGIANALRSGALAAREASYFLRGEVSTARRYSRRIRAELGVRLQLEALAHRIAGTPATIDPWLAIARGLHVETQLARALLALG